MQRKENAHARAPKDAAHLSFGIAVSRFNGDFTEPMLEGALAVLREAKVKEEHIHIVRVPGSFELPYGCLKLLEKKPSALIAIGCIVKGETDHDKYLADAVTQGLMRLMLDHKLPVVSGVTTANTLEQAHARADGEHNRGAEAAHAAIEAALL